MDSCQNKVAIILKHSRVCTSTLISLAFNLKHLKMFEAKPRLFLLSLLTLLGLKHFNFTILLILQAFGRQSAAFK
jgi:hypothetical protein